MLHASHRLLPPFAAAFSLFAAAGAQDPVRFEPVAPTVRMSIVDAPALLQALPQMHLGRLFADPEVHAAIERGRVAYVHRVQAWCEVLDRLLQLDPGSARVDAVVQRDVMALDWRDLRTAEMIATRPPEGSRGRLQTTLSLESVPAAEGRMTQAYEQLAARLRAIAADANHPAQVEVGGDKVGDFPALVLKPRGNGEEWSFVPPGHWLLHLPGQFVGGDGVPDDAGRCQPTDRRPAAIAMHLRLRPYLDLMAGSGAENPMLQPILQALGLEHAEALDWQLRPAGELLQDDLSLSVQGRVGGLLGALVESSAPLVEQPLPEHGLLQLRCAFDVGALMTAVDELLVLGELPTLADLGLADDLKQAWTGGLAFAVARPAPGGLVPRLYASFGVADAPAFGRLLARLHELPGLQPKEVTYEGKPCTQLRLDGAPPVLQPSYCLQDGVAHFAESGISLRALLKAQANDAPPALDVGDAPRPDGPGAVLPNFDLRFDGAAIHTALHELWLPLAGTVFGSGPGSTPLLTMQEMPDPEAVTAHLRPGRGVLRRAPDRITLSMSGTAGGPEMHVLLSSYGPALSGPLTGSWTWRADSLRYDLARLQMQAIHAALTRFHERTERFPASFGELLAAGDLADAGMLVLPGDDGTEPVEHDGKEVARTSFRYFPDGQEMTPQGEKVLARLATLHELGYRSLVLDVHGNLHDSWAFRGLGQLMQVQAVEEIVVEEPPPPPEPADDDQPK